MRVLILLCLAVPALCNQKVVGGSGTSIATHPHQLSLRSGSSHSCGASLIATNKGVTAAHCGGGAVSSYSVLAGSTDWATTTCATCSHRAVTSFVLHASFANDGSRGYPNDVAVLYFSAVATNGNVAIIGLASSGTFAGQSCVISGWGRTCGSCGIPNTLQQGSMTVLTNADCAGQWSSAQINDGHICVQSPSVSACSGDSGGPLVCGGQLVGATSWGQSQCSPSFPSVYTRITYFRTWITSN